MALQTLVGLIGRSLLMSRGTGLRRISSGALPSKPITYHSFGIVKVVTVSAPFIYIGAFAAKSFAAYLEDFDLFVPDDDDD